MQKETQVIWAFGHENIQCDHPTTLMVTKDKQISKTGDCIVAVAADRAAIDFSSTFRETLKKPNVKVKIVIEAGNLTQQITAFGSSSLQLCHPTDIVIRKSKFISDRTIAICSDKASKDLSRLFIEKLKNSKQLVKITLIIEV